ncbi:MAG: PTS sugar transporter subunit IIB [Calditrichia bacterium]|nr:PTS sugar transporter subunit IIB [Calditrichia bacterium]
MLQLVRIDDRLVHGQVVVGWGNSLHFQRIIVCDNELGREEWEIELMRNACPPGIEILFINEETLINRTNEFENDRIKTIVLMGNISVLRRLVALNFSMSDINVGGIHYEAGREQLLSYLYLNGEEKENLKYILGKGYHLFAQDLPTNKKIELADLI